MKFRFALRIEGGAGEMALCLLTELGLIRHTLRQEQPYIMYSCSTLTEATGRGGSFSFLLELAQV